MVSKYDKDDDEENRRINEKNKQTSMESKNDDKEEIKD